jgi:pseudouridylate synthase
MNGPGGAGLPVVGSPVVFLPEVAESLAAGGAVVALESTIISHGLPRPRNLEVARELEDLVRKEGACPATIAVLDGVAHVGLSEAQLERAASDPTLRKLGTRDLPMALALGASGATTVSATAWLASLAGIKVFATGGLGGVHRGYAQTLDESADLGILSRCPITVISAGVKSILDVAATLERLESLSVSVVGYRTTDFPGFYLSRSGCHVDWAVSCPEDVAAIMRQRQALGLGSALLVANPVPEDEQLSPALHDEALARALREAQERGVSGQALTPFLLSRLVDVTEGASLQANLAAVRGNVRLGAQIAVACT